METFLRGGKRAERYRRDTRGGEPMMDNKGPFVLNDDQNSFTAVKPLWLARRLNKLNRGTRTGSVQKSMTQRP